MGDELNDSIFDTVIIGTGPVESIIASALAKRGKKILHLDKNDYYGKDFATFTLLELINYCKNGFHKKNSDLTSSVLGSFDTKVIDFTKIETSDIMPLQCASKLCSKSHPACIGYVLEKLTDSDINTCDSSRWHPTFHQYSTVEMTLPRALHFSRKFSIDLSPFQLLFGTGSMVECMVNSGVAKYMEFRCVEQIFMQDEESPLLSLMRVPCSKADVFKTKLLSGLEKRGLMKLLQVAADWGRLHEGHELTTLNERLLGQGSALHRPQNKRASAVDVDITGFENKPLCDFLTHFGLSDRLQGLIQHSLCFDSAPRYDISPLTQSVPNQIQSRPPLSTPEGLDALYRHLLSMGRYGDTGLLTPLYGVGEVPQAFCRACAVWGGIYMLRTDICHFRRSLIMWPMDVPKVEGTVNTTEEPKKEEGDYQADPEYLSDSPAQKEVSEDRQSDSYSAMTMVHSSLVEDLAYPSVEETIPEEDLTGEYITMVTDSTGREFKCRNVICSAQDLPCSFVSEEYKSKLLSSVSLVCRSSVLSSRVLPVGLGLLVLPPMTSGVDNPQTVFITQKESCVQVCPSGSYLLYISTSVSTSTCESEAVALLEKVILFLQKDSNFKEIFQISMLKPLLSNIHTSELSAWPRNLFITRHTSPQIEMYDIADQARNIFMQMFPDLPFLPQESSSLNDENENTSSADDELNL